MWQGILAEAAQRICEIKKDAHAETYKSATAIILARTSWQIFLSEFIQWRDLSPKLKKQDFKPAVISVLKEVSTEGEIPTFSGGTIWDDLQLLNDVRNAIIHHKAERRSPNQSPYDLLKRLGERRLLKSETDNRTWEVQVLNSEVATWACITVGSTIIELENFPAKRYRSIDNVCRQVLSALEPLPNSKKVLKQTGKAVRKL